jgi:hypothetical protein
MDAVESRHLNVAIYSFSQSEDRSACMKLKREQLLNASHRKLSQKTTLDARRP